MTPPISLGGSVIDAGFEVAIGPPALIYKFRVHRRCAGNTTGQLAVEIDTYQNEFDPDGNHVGVDIATIVSNATSSLSSFGVDPKIGKPVTFQIHYDGWTKNLEVSAGYAGQGPLRSVLNFTIAIARMMSSSPVYVGFTGSTGPSLGYRKDHRVLSWNFSSTTLPAWSLDYRRPKRKRSNIGTVLGIGLAVVVGLPLLGLLSFLGVRRVRKWKRRRKLEAMSKKAANAPKMYTYDQLVRATGHFSSLLGKGGFGSVYKGHLSNPPSEVAVKKMSATSKQGEKEYFAEICTIGRLRHRNLVQLQGWCHSGKNLLLVYQFMPKGSLDRHIAAGTLDWPTRHHILLGLASALLYLHEECGGPVVHRDVKPNNVLLDDDFDAHLGDFGLARLLQSADRATSTTILAGTVGYLAPECGYTGKASPESDVFSYGVVVLEVICGRRSLLCYDDNNLLDIVWNLYTTGELLRAVDPRLEGRFDEEQVGRVLLTGLMCAHPSPAYRPKIRKVVNILDNPNEPLMEMPASRPDTIAASPMTMGREIEGLSSIMDTSTIPPPPGTSSTDSSHSTASSVLNAR
ncbi:hypothetical protein Taro_005842 [Colocasia esculenta]|uniref:non-specific serine/threonine protein kinase n=1 Tax=Colocasia esculenta TaxID=4460 RepID=A0A843TQW0_COLES|nr:hypothetical protein [Colocasia esculenta]